MADMETRIFLAMMEVRQARNEMNAAGEYERAGLLAEAEDRLVKVHDRLFDEKMAKRKET